MQGTAAAVDRSARCAVAIMAKAPSAGRTKTRLSPFLSYEEARELAGCFLADMTANIAAAALEASVDPYIAFAPLSGEAALRPIVHDGTGFVLADGSAPAPAGVEGLGRSLLQAARALFARGYGAVALLNADSPTLPTALLVEAARLLSQPEDAVVLGPSADGGYYLIGMKAPHACLFAGIDWSTARVAQQTRLRAGEAGLKQFDLATWYDVDDAGALRRLIEELDGNGGASARLAGFAAPVTAAWVRGNRVRERLAMGGAPHAAAGDAMSAT